MLFPFFKNAYALAAIAFLLGLGCGCGMPVSMSLIYALSPRERVSDSTGLRSTIFNFSELVIPLVFSSVGMVFGYFPVFISNSVILVAGGFLMRRNIARVMAMGKMHKTFAITAAIPAAIAAVIAAVIPDSVVNEVVAGGKPVSPGKEIVIGHPSGMMDVKVETRIEKEKLLVVSCTIGRTARKIMDGKVYIPRTVYSAGR